MNTQKLKELVNAWEEAEENDYCISGKYSGCRPDEIIRYIINEINSEPKTFTDDSFEGLLSEPITSSNIDKVGYNKEKKELLVRFKNGGLYKYVEVPYIEYERLVEARSAGSWFHRNIRSKFECEKINEITEEVPDNPNLQ